jgi:hypothetical protein
MYRKRILTGLRNIYARVEEMIWMIELIKDSNLAIENFRPSEFSRC